jgi:DNA-binding MarR family transcriptional regulator
MPDPKALARSAHDACVCNSVRRASRAITQLYDEMLRPSGLRVTQFGILGAAMAMSPITLTRLAKATVTDRTTLTRNLKLLEQQGLIRVEQGGDRREREISITREGTEALKKAYPLWQKAQTQVISGLGPKHLKAMQDELAAATALLRKA